MNNESERAAFEAWVCAKTSLPCTCDAYGFYVNTTVQDWWRVWQAARAESANETGAEGTDAFAHEVWSAAQRAPGEGIEDAVQRIAAILSRSPAMAAEAVAIPNSPAYCLRGLYKPADEYFIDGKPCTPDEYIAWQAGIIEAVTKAKLPDPKYYGGSAEEGDQHDVKCAYVDGWNDCRASILATPQPAQADARVGLTAIQAVLREIDPKWRERGEFGVKPHDQIIAAIRDLAAHPGQPEPRASAGVIAAALAVIEADRAQTLTTEHIDALDNAIKIQRGELNLPEPRAEVTDDQIAAMFERVTGYSLENGRAALNDADILGFARELLEAARTGASS